MDENNLIWVTKSDGILRKEGEVYSNKRFVEKIANDTTPIGRYMASFYPTSIDIRLLSDKIPSSWVQWEYEDIDVDKMESLIHLPDEVYGLDRLTLSKSEVSKRIRECMESSFMTVTPRGIKSKGVPDTPIETFATIVSSAYLSVEKNTTASVRRKNNVNIPLDKKKRFENTLDIISKRTNILQTMLTSAYVEPAPTIINRAYLLGEIYGMSTVNAVLNDIYYRKCAEQTKAVLELSTLLDN